MRSYDDVLEQAPGPYRLHPPTQRSEPNRGRKVLSEVVFSTLLFSVVLVGFGGWYAADNLLDRESLRLERGKEFLNSTMDALAVYTFDDVSTMNGSAMHDSQDPQDSDFRVEFDISRAARGLLRVQAILRDARTQEFLERRTVTRSRT